MDDLMSTIQNVLNDPESLKQVQELAAMLGQGMSDQPQTESPDVPAAAAPQAARNTPTLPVQPQQAANAPMPDLAKLMQLREIASQAGSSDNNIRLLTALRPMMKAENQAKIDRLIKLYRLMAIYPALKKSGLLGGDLFGLL